MSNYVGRRERFIGNSGPQNEAKNIKDGVDAVKMFFTQEAIEIIIRETNTYAERCIKCSSSGRRTEIFSSLSTTNG
jgi:hypothetical protein